MEYSPSQHAILFGLLAQKTIAVFGSGEGESLLLEAVLRYGGERGERMAQRARRAGVALDMVSYFAYCEWSDPNAAAPKVISREPEYVNCVLSCPWNETWKKHGMRPYGKYYCRCIDKAVLHGFNPELRLRVETTLNTGGDCCRFRWESIAMTENTQARLERMKAGLDGTQIRDFRYHTAHLYAAFADVLSRTDALRADSVLRRTQADFVRLTSPECLHEVLETAGSF